MWFGRQATKLASNELFRRLPMPSSSKLPKGAREPLG
jgi:hypothetical protein